MTNNGDSPLRRAPLRWRFCAYALMFIFALLTIYPLVWLAYSSLKPTPEILRNPLALPKQPTLNNYITAWEMAGLGSALLNSAFYTIVSTGITVFLALAAAFGLAKFPFKNSNIFISAFALGLMITVHAVIIPLFLVEVRLGIVNTRFGIILPYVAFGLPLSVMIALSFVRGIPGSLIESAEIDGAKYRAIFWKIIVPLSTPVIATMTILSFLSHWNEFLFVFVFTSSAALKSLPPAITIFAGKRMTEYGLQYAALMIGILPMLIFYICFHSQLIKGFGEGALKE
jgi:raffinose/stachyose/melibiose transport system permease protein